MSDLWPRRAAGEAREIQKTRGEARARPIMWSFGQEKRGFAQSPKTEDDLATSGSIFAQFSDPVATCGAILGTLGTT